MAYYLKTFDTVDYPILLKKIHKLRFGKNSLKLITGYLSDRYQLVQVDDKQTDYRLVTQGVPEGSIFGPILFNIYVSDMREHTS